MFRSYWKGQLSVGLINIPISLVKATESKYVTPFHLYDMFGRKVIKPNCVEADGMLQRATDLQYGYESEKGLVFFSKDDVKQLQQATSTEIKVLGFLDFDVFNAFKTSDMYALLPQQQKKGKQYFLVGGEQYSLLATENYTNE